MSQQCSISSSKYGIDRDSLWFWFPLLQFLSMKLASVNPRLDFDVENFLAKEVMVSQLVEVLYISEWLGFQKELREKQNEECYNHSRIVSRTCLRSSNLSRATSLINNFFIFYKQQMQSHASTTMMMGPNPTAMLYGHHQQPQQHQVHNLQSFGPSGLDFTPAKSASEACIRRTMSAPVAAPWSCLDAFADNLSQVKNTS